jgi:hypothetical protein
MAANAILKFDVCMVLIGKVIGGVLGFCIGSLFGCLWSSIHRHFLKGYLRAASSHKEALEFLYFRDQAQKLKRDKGEK